MKIITLYTKLGCHLCEAVERTIATVIRKKKFILVRRDISEDLADYEKYKHDVPVVLVDGVEIARHRMLEEELVKSLSEEA